MKMWKAGLIFFIIVFSLSAQEVRFSYKLEPRYKIIERADFSKKLNGSYLGYVNREVRGLYQSSDLGDGRYQVEGRWYTAQEIKKEGQAQALPLDRLEQGSFIQDLSGNMTGLYGTEGPVFRNFPVFPNESVRPGDRWEAPMSMVIQDLYGQSRAEIPLYCAYSFEGEGEYQNRSVYYVKAQFATRYRRGSSAQADRFLSDVQGSHVVTITIDSLTMSPVLMRDSFKESWVYRDGQTLETRGFNLTFFDGISLMNRGEAIQNLSRGLGNNIRILPGTEEEPIHLAERENRGDEQDNLQQQMEEFASDFDEDITLYEGNDGLTLSLNNLHFLPDQAVILGEDRPLLDQIAQTLSLLPEKTLLVKGHTAHVGSMESQMVLSMERAAVVVEELTKRGIAADRFLYIGLGGSEPIASNEDEEGRRLNRRVEIVLMED